MNSSSSQNDIDPWEAASAAFETPEEEIRKFSKRLLKMGTAAWRRDAGMGLHPDL